MSFVQKSNMYIFLFLTGIVDVYYDNILISKKCFKPVFVDNDSMTIIQAQYGKYPFQLFDKETCFPSLSKEDYESAPFHKVVTLKNPSIQTLKSVFPDLRSNRMNDLKKIIKRQQHIYWFKYKCAYWIKDIKKFQPVHTHLLPFNSVLHYSSKTVKKLRLLNKRTLEKILIEDSSGQYHQNIINGILYRRDVILKEVESLKKKEVQF